MEVLIVQIYILLIILFFFLALAIVRWIKNENSSVNRVPVTIIHMRRKKHLRAHYQSYHVTFQVEDGAQIELRVNHNEYDAMSVGDRGVLTHQGTRYKGFERII